MDRAVPFQRGPATGHKSLTLVPCGQRQEASGGPPPPRSLRTLKATSCRAGRRRLHLAGLGVTNMSAGSFPLCPVLRDMRARGAPSASARRHGAGAKSWALAGHGQRSTAQVHRPPPQEERAQVTGGGQSPCEAREALGRGQVVRVQAGVLSWLVASFLTVRQGSSWRELKEPGGVPLGLPLASPATRAERQAAHMPPTACTEAAVPSPSLQLLDGVLVKALSQAQYGDIWRAGGGGKRELEQPAQIPDHSRPPPSPRPGLDAGTGERDADRPALVEAGVSLTGRAQHPNP